MSEAIQKVPITTAAVEEKVPDAASVTASMKKLGLTKISFSTVKDLKKVGLAVSSVGVLRTTQGGIFVNQQRLDSVIRAAVEMAEKLKNAPRPMEKVVKNGEDIEIDAEVSEMSPEEKMAMLLKSISLAIGKSTDSQKLMLETAGLRYRRPGEQDAPETPNRKSFLPGQVVNVQINSTPNSEVKVNGEKVVASPTPSS